MADDATLSALTHGGALLGGGGVTAWAVRVLFSGFSKRLDDIEHTLKELTEKVDTRHESLIERLALVEAKTDACHKRMDELKRARR